MRRFKLWSKKPKQIVSGSGYSVIVTSGEGKLSVRKSFSGDISDKEHIKRLVSAVINIYEEIDVINGKTNKQHNDVKSELKSISNSIDNEKERVNKLEIISGDVRKHLYSLLFIGVGTFLTVLPTICQLIKAIF